MVNDVIKRRYRAEKEFGLIVGGIFLLLGAWWIYRGKLVTPSYVLAVAGSLLLFFALIWPGALVYPNKAWMLLAEGMSFVMTRVILAIVFFLIVTPIGVTKRLMGWDPLSRRAAPGESYWKEYSERQRDPRHYEKMY